VVVALPTFFQPPLVLRWILTGTLASHAVNASPTLTTPLATTCFFRDSVTLLEWGMLTVKFAALVAVPPGVVTLILPVVAPVGTVAVIWVAEFTVNEVAVVVLNFTELVVKLAPLMVPLKFVPVIVTDVPTGPKAGVNELIVGAGTGVTVKLVVLVFCPAAVYTWIGPVVAPAGTTAVAPVVLGFVGVTRLEVLKRTPVTIELNVPLSVTVEPTMPLVGEKVGAFGQATSGPVEYVNDGEAGGLSLLVTTTFAGLLAPGVAPPGIVTSSWVAESTVSPVPSAPAKVTFTGVKLRPVPIIVTSHVREAAVGVTDVTVGGAA